MLELAAAIANSIEPFYNDERRHSSLNDLTPSEFEALHFVPSTQATLP